MQIPFDPSPDVKPAGASGAFLSVPERPNAFGAGVAAAEQKMGSTLDTAGAQQAQVAEMFQKQYNETATDAANTDFEGRVRDSLFGPDGFYSKRGRDAMDAMKPTAATLEGLRTDTRDSLANNEQRRMFDYMSRRSAVVALKQMSAHANTEFNVWQGETAKGAIANEVNNSATYWNDDRRFAQSIGNIKIQTAKLLALKGIDPASETGQAEMTHYTSEAWSARIRSVMQQDPSIARELFDANADQMDAPHRAQLDAQIQQHQWTSMMRDEAQARRAEAQAAKDLHNNQVAAESGILADEYSGKPWSMTKLADMVRTQQISPSMLGAIRAARTAAADSPSDPRLLASMYARLNDPNNPLTKDEVLNAAGRGLHGAAAASLMQALNAQGRREESPVERGYYASLKSALGGHNVEQGLVDFGKVAEKEQANLWSQAQAEWTQRTKVKGEDPQSVFADMMPRYQREPAVPASWPAPRMGAVASSQDVATVAARTKAAIESGQLTPAQGAAEAQLLGNYARFYQEKEARAKATAEAMRTVAGKPVNASDKRAKVRGAVPQEQ